MLLRAPCCMQVEQSPLLTHSCHIHVSAAQARMAAGRAACARGSCVSSGRRPATGGCSSWWVAGRALGSCADAEFNQACRLREGREGLAGGGLGAWRGRGSTRPPVKGAKPQPLPPFTRCARSAPAVRAAPHRAPAGRGGLRAHRDAAGGERCIRGAAAGGHPPLQGAGRRGQGAVCAQR